MQKVASDEFKKASGKSYHTNNDKNKTKGKKLPLKKQTKK